MFTGSGARLQNDPLHESHEHNPPEICSHARRRFLHLRSWNICPRLLGCVRAGFHDRSGGKTALSQDRAGYCRFLWSTFSPTWHFDEATFARTAASFDNPDFVEVVLHSYRFRIGAVPGDPALETTERLLSAQPKITVPTVVLEGADDGVDPPAKPGTVAGHFTNLRRQTVLPGVGHNLPQEAPEAFCEAVLALGE